MSMTINSQDFIRLVEISLAARQLLDNHEEAWGSCKHCLEDGRGVCAEQLDTLLKVFEERDR